MKRSEMKRPPGSTSPAASDPPAYVVAALDDGDEVTFTVGAETFSPIRFHTFTVGPVQVKTRLRPRETAPAAIERARLAAQHAFDEEHARKLAAFLERVRDVAVAAKARSGERG